MPFDASVLLPGKNGIRCQFHPIIADHHAGIATPLYDNIQSTGHALARDRSVGNGRQAFVREIVDYAQDTEAVPIN